jgi:hypothetical protein
MVRRIGFPQRRTSIDHHQLARNLLDARFLFDMILSSFPPTTDGHGASSLSKATGQ